MHKNLRKHLESRKKRFLKIKSVLNFTEKSYRINRIFWNICKNKNLSILTIKKLQFFLSNLIHNVGALLLRIIWNVCKKNVIKIGVKNIGKKLNIFFVSGRAPKLPGSWGLRLPHPNRVIIPQAPDAFGFHSPSHLVIGYHSLAFLNQVRKNL